MKMVMTHYSPETQHDQEMQTPERPMMLGFGRINQMNLFGSKTPSTQPTFLPRRGILLNANPHLFRWGFTYPGRLTFIERLLFNERVNYSLI